MSDEKRNPKPDIPTLKTLLNDLAPVKHKWRKICIQLDIPNSKLHQYEKDGDSITNGLDYWLNGNTDVPVTWESVVAALDAPDVDEPGLAKILREKWIETTDKATKQTIGKNDDVSPSTPETKERFPYLQITDLTEEQKDELIERLTSESDRIKTQFAVLVSKTSISLKNNDVSVGNLKLTLKSLGLDELVEKIYNESDLTEALITASDYWSFFDYETVTSIISSYCTNLQQEAESYISSFKIYCQRRLCEVPIDNFKTEIHKKTTKLHVKMDETFTIPLNKVKKIERKLSSLLDTSLRLLKIEDGCIELIFSCLRKIHLLFPLNSQQEEDLLQMGVLRLYDDTCEYYHAPSQDKSPSLSLPPSQLPAVKQLSSIDDLMLPLEKSELSLELNDNTTTDLSKESQPDVKIIKDEYNQDAENVSDYPSDVVTQRDYDTKSAIYIMTEPADSVEKSMQELEKEISCAVCHGHYNEPKVLPCCHYYCKECIYSLASKIGLDKLFSCPECRMNITLPQGSVDNLPTAFFINRLKQVHSKLEKAHGKVDAKCELCRGAKAEAFCPQCASLICTDCVKSHQRMKKTFSGHKVSSLEELKSGLSVRDIVMEESPLQMCEVHTKKMKIYCFDCSCLICRDCTIKNHLGHNYEFIKVAATEMKKKFIEDMYPLEEVKASLSHAVKEIQSTKSEIEAQGVSVNNKLESWFEHLHEIIEQRKQELLKEVATKVTKKLNCLSFQDKKLSTECAVIQSVIEYTHRCVKHSADDEFMCMHTEINSRIEREIKEHCKEGRSLEPVEEVDIGVEVSCAKELKELCQTKARITQIPIECTVEGEGVKTAEINKLSELSVIIKLSDGKNVKQKYDVDCHLKTLANGFTVKCKVNLIQGNKYHIQYTPTIRGRHEVVLTVNGQAVVGSPFPVFVSIPSFKLGKPVGVIRGLTIPRFIAINSVGEILVTELGGDVTVFDNEGKKLRKISSSDYNIKDPTGVAVDENDSIYIADCGNHKILKFNKEVKFTKEVSVKKDSWLWGVTVLGDEIMVCDNNYSCVMVYTKELEYARQIDSPGKGPGQFNDIRDVSSDKHGNLYVSNLGNYRIQVLSNGGEYLRSIGCDRNSLKWPFGVCISGQYVYAADYNKHNISVYTTMGKYVTTLGQWGSNEGEYRYPLGVCTDKDGYIYVCDSGNKRVQIL